MYANNVSSGNGTSATDIDVGIGQTSVALRVLYEYFTSGGNYDYGEFVKMCKNFEITISMALKGPLESMFRESFYLLPLSLLWDQEQKMYTEK
ncbi:unnamed protein product [Rhizophagus irregularis]|nr:unnamed protein product [Rhizophagus irregularis]